MKLRRALTVAAASIALFTTSMTAASASSPPRLGWQQVTYASFTLAAGDVCSFGVQADIVRQDVWFRTIVSNPDGTPKQQLFVGPLYIRYSNLSSGKAATENLSGTALIDYAADGSQTWYVIGPFAASIHAGNPYEPQGEYLLSGYTKLVIHPGHIVQFVEHHGPSANVCAAIG